MNVSLIRDKFSFIVVTESWLKHNSEFGYELLGYKSTSVYKVQGNEFFYLDLLKVEKAENLMGSKELYESLFHKVRIPKLGSLVVFMKYFYCTVS